MKRTYELTICKASSSALHPYHPKRSFKDALTEAYCNYYHRHQRWCKACANKESLPGKIAQYKCERERVRIYLSINLSLTTSKHAPADPFLEYYPIHDTNTFPASLGPSTLADKGERKLIPEKTLLDLSKRCFHQNNHGCRPRGSRGSSMTKLRFPGPTAMAMKSRLQTRVNGTNGSSPAAAFL